MTNKLAFAIAACAALAAAGGLVAAFAWDAGPKKSRTAQRAEGRNQAAYLLDFDADKDGRITRVEVDTGLAAQFSAADKNADGKLDPAEFQRHNDQRRAERKARYEAWRAKQEAEGATPKPFVDRGPRAFDPMKNMDWDLDGYISPEEFSGKIRAQAMRADRDGDGTVLAADLKRSPRKKDTKAQ